jgi:hypothetical protein
MQLLSVSITTNVVSPNLAQEKCTQYNIMWWRLSVTCGSSMDFSGTPVSSTNKTYRHDITEILLKVILNTITRISFTWISTWYYLQCILFNYRCIIIEDNGFIVMHPSFKESTNADKFLKSIHITVEVSGVVLMLNYLS